MQTSANKQMFELIKDPIIIPPVGFMPMVHDEKYSHTIVVQVFS